MSEKPPYRVPLMSEIARIKPNGLRVISTFAGGGGSSLGYRMAGFKVLWASEFIDAARDVYQANAAPGTIVDGRDIREVDPLEVLRAVGLRPGELDVLDGSPPCSSFSTAGKREKGWGEVKKYSDKAQRTDDLFFEFIRFVRAIRPKVFVAENVSGLVKGTAKGYFIEILREMKACGYRVNAQLLDAQWLGVPQQRQRIIFVGVRDDLGIEPVHPKPLPYRYSVRDAIGGLDGRVTTKRTRRSLDDPAPTIMTHNRKGTQSEIAIERSVERETDISSQAIGREYDKLNPGEQSEKYFSLVRTDENEPCPTVTAGGGMNSGIATVTHPTEKRKFSIAELKRICAFPDDFKMSGNYARDWERLGRAVPPLMMLAISSTIRDKILLVAKERQECSSRESSSASGPTSRKARVTRAGRGKVRGSRRRESTVTSA